MAELHYSILSRGATIRYHGTFRHVGRIGKEAVSKGLGEAIKRKWGLSGSDIEELECYYFKNGKEIMISKYNRKNANNET